MSQRPCAPSMSRGPVALSPGAGSPCSASLGDTAVSGNLCGGHSWGLGKRPLVSGMLIDISRGMGRRPHHRSIQPHVGLVLRFGNPAVDIQVFSEHLLDLGPLLGRDLGNPVRGRSCYQSWFPGGEIQSTEGKSGVQSQALDKWPSWKWKQRRPGAHLITLWLTQRAVQRCWVRPAWALGSHSSRFESCL